MFAFKCEKIIKKSQDWIKKYGHIKWVIANRWVFPSHDAPNIVHTTKNKFDHTLWGVYQYQCYTVYQYQ